MVRAGDKFLDLRRAVGLASALCVLFGGAAAAREAPGRLFSSKTHDELYAVYNSSAASMLERLHAWRLLSRIGDGLARPDYGTAPANASIASAWIAASKGGRVARADGTAIDVWAGVLPADGLVYITTSAASGSSARLSAAEASGLAPASDEVVFGPPGVRLHRSVALTLKYPQWQVNASRLRVYCWQASSNQWVRLPSQADSSRQTLATSALSLMPCRVFIKK